MAAPQYVYTMQKLSKTYPGGKPVLNGEDCYRMTMTR